MFSLAVIICVQRDGCFWSEQQVSITVKVSPSQVVADREQLAAIIEALGPGSAVCLMMLGIFFVLLNLM